MATRGGGKGLMPQEACDTTDLHLDCGGWYVNWHKGHNGLQEYTRTHTHTKAHDASETWINDAYVNSLVLILNYSYISCC